MKFGSGDLIARKYRIEGSLGEGGMGVVLSAVDTELERPVAIKLLLPEHVANPRVKTRFIREARAAARIQSEHVVRVFEVGTLDSGEPFMALELLRGADLSVVLDSEGPLCMHDAIGFVLQACEAIAEAHAAGIVHRDLKPANLFLARLPGGTSTIKVLDFGISKSLLLDTDGSGSVTRTNSVVGSPLYMSPEQARSSGSIDARTDIWSLGVVLFELLTARPPFDAESFADFSVEVLTKEAPDVRSLRPELPAGLAQVIARALTKDPSGRYQTVADFAFALLEFAPKRARLSVERISAVCHAAGMLAEPLPIGMSLEPPQAVPIQIVPVPPAAAVPIIAVPDKAPGWVRTIQGTPKRRDVRLFAAASAAALLLGASMVTLIARPSSATEHSMVAASVERATNAVESGALALAQPSSQPETRGSRTDSTVANASADGSALRDDDDAAPSKAATTAASLRRTAMHKARSGGTHRDPKESLVQLQSKFGGRE